MSSNAISHYTSVAKSIESCTEFSNNPLVETQWMKSTTVFSIRRWYQFMDNAFNHVKRKARQMDDERRGGGVKTTTKKDVDEWWPLFASTPSMEHLRELVMREDAFAKFLSRTATEFQSPESIKKDDLFDISVTIEANAPHVLNFINSKIIPHLKTIAEKLVRVDRAPPRMRFAVDFEDAVECVSMFSTVHDMRDFQVMCRDATKSASFFLGLFALPLFANQFRTPALLSASSLLGRFVAREGFLSRFGLFLHTTQLEIMRRMNDVALRGVQDWILDAYARGRLELRHAHVVYLKFGETTNRKVKHTSAGVSKCLLPGIFQSPARVVSGEFTRMTRVFDDVVSPAALFRDKPPKLNHPLWITVRAPAMSVFSTAEQVIGVGRARVHKSSLRSMASRSERIRHLPVVLCDVEWRSRSLGPDGRARYENVFGVTIKNDEAVAADDVLPGELIQVVAGEGARVVATMRRSHWKEPSSSPDLALDSRERCETVPRGGIASVGENVLDFLSKGGDVRAFMSSLHPVVDEAASGEPFSSFEKIITASKPGTSTLVFRIPLLCAMTPGEVSDILETEGEAEVFVREPAFAVRVRLAGELARLEPEPKSWTAARRTGVPTITEVLFPESTASS